MIATATPSPCLILTWPEQPQYPWEWENMADRAQLMPDSGGAGAAD